MKKLIFVDDSGDPGFKAASSANFIMAGVVFEKTMEAEKLSQRITEFRRALGWRDDYEFKFAKIRKDIIVELLKTVVEYDFQVYIAYIDKNYFHDMVTIIDRQKLYIWAIKELLTMIPTGDAKIEIDGRSSKAYMQKVSTYLRKCINPNKTKKIEIRFRDSARENLVQLADLVAGSVNRYLSNSKTDVDVYYKIIKKKIVKMKAMK